MTPRLRALRKACQEGEAPPFAWECTTQEFCAAYDEAERLRDVLGCLLAACKTLEKSNGYGFDVRAGDTEWVVSAEAGQAFAKAVKKARKEWMK